MSDDLRQVGPRILKLIEDMARVSRLLRPSYVSLYEELERPLRMVRREHMEIARSVSFRELAAPGMTAMIQATQHWQDLIGQATGSPRLVQDLNRVHQTWLDKIRPVEHKIAGLQAAASLSIADLAYRMTVTERLFAGLDFDAMRQVVVLPEQMFSNLQSVIGDVTFAYERLVGSIRALPDVTGLPTFSLPGATREVFLTGHALHAIYNPNDEEGGAEAQLVAESEQEISGWIGLLQAVDPALTRPYIGAHEALRGRSADRARHILSSLREFWSHLLRRLAPDAQVLSWIPKDSKDLLHQGRPTRKARVLYVCRGVGHGPLGEFVVQDIGALVKLVEFFNRVHELDPGLSDQQLRALLLRTDSWVSYLLQIWEGRE